MGGIGIGIRVEIVLEVIREFGSEFEGYGELR